jgi:hypothetical protein
LKVAKGGWFGECALHLLESSRGFRIVEILVGVVNSCKASVGTLDLFISGCSLDLQRLIVVECCWSRHLANGSPPNATKVSGNYRRNELLERRKKEIGFFVLENETAN